MRIRLVTISLFCVFLTLAGCGGSRAIAENDGDWQFLGKRTVHGKHDVDVIEVGRKEGHFHHIRLEVRGSALEMHNVVVTFGDGEKFSPETRLVFGKGEHSRTIDLPGGARIIRSVRFNYSNLPRGGRAHVRLLAR